MNAKGRRRHRRIEERIERRIEEKHKEEIEQKDGDLRTSKFAERCLKERLRAYESVTLHPPAKDDPMLIYPGEFLPENRWEKGEKRIRLRRFRVSRPVDRRMLQSENREQYVDHIKSSFTAIIAEELQNHYMDHIDVHESNFKTDCILTLSILLPVPL
jgi:hypothetical protein